MIRKIGVKIHNYWIHTDKYYKAEWIVLILVLLFSMISRSYSDMISTNFDAQRFLQWTFSEKFLRVSEIMSSCPYGLSFFIVYAIGFFPIWIIGMITPYGDFIAETMGAVIWMKFYLAIFSVGVAYEMLQIAKKLGISKVNRKWLLFAFFSSLFVFLPVFQVGQYDIFALFFILLGINFYLEDRNIPFLLSFAFAIPMKYFALFIFVPLVLLKYKKIWKIAIELLAGVSFFLYERFIYATLLPSISRMLFGLGEASGQVATAASEAAENGTSLFSGESIISWQVDFFFKNRLTIGNYEISLVIFALTLVCIGAFVMKRRDTIKEFSYQVVSLSLICLVCFFLFVNSWNSYWIVLIAPFLLLFVFANSSNLRLNIILETVITVITVIGKMLHQNWVFGGQYGFFYGILKYTNPRPMNVGYLLDKYKFSKYYFVFYAILIACLIVFLIYNLWTERKRRLLVDADGPNTDIDALDTIVSRGWWWLRIALLLVVTFAELYLAYWQ